MAANMKAVKLRIKSIQNTMQITKAMELVASSKLRRAKDRADRCKPYFETLADTLHDISRENADFTSVFAKPNESDHWCYVMISGDRGMAGGYNANVIRFLENEAKGKEITILPVGKKSLEYGRHKNVEMLSEEYDQVQNIKVADCYEMAEMLCDGYRSGRFGHIAVCFTEFVSMMTQKPDVQALLPLSDLSAGEETKKGQYRNLILYEPSAEEVFDAIVPEYLAGLLYSAVCQSLASELASRRTAMEAATDNAGEMIDTLSLHYNRARQASITQEITEIVAGAEDL